VLWELRRVRRLGWLPSPFNSSEVLQVDELGAYAEEWHENVVSACGYAGLFGIGRAFFGSPRIVAI
jgi:hypothetical protein